MKKKIILIMIIFIMLPSFTYATSFDPFDGIKKFISEKLDNFMESLKENMVKWVTDAILAIPNAIGDAILDTILQPLATMTPNILLEIIEIEKIKIVNSLWNTIKYIGISIACILLYLGVSTSGLPFSQIEDTEVIYFRFIIATILILSSKYLLVNIYELGGHLAVKVFNDINVTMFSNYILQLKSIHKAQAILKVTMYFFGLIPMLIFHIGIFVIAILRILDILIMTTISPLAFSTFTLKQTEFVGWNFLYEFIGTVLVQFILIIFLIIATSLATFDFDVANQLLDSSNIFVATVGYSIMYISICIYVITRPNWIKKLFRMGTPSTVSNLAMAVKMFF